MKKFLSLILALSLFFTCFSQHTKKVTIEMLKKSQSDIDPAAPAEYLENSIFQHVDFDPASGHFYLYKEYFVRVKVYDKDRFDGGTVSFLLSDQPGVLNQLTGFKMYTYNLEGNKITKIKTAKKDLHLEEVSQYVNQYKVAVPGIKDGTVFEYSYTIKTEKLFTEKWYFQTDLPVVYSSFAFRYPDYLKYKYITENIYDQSPKIENSLETYLSGNSKVEIPFIVSSMEMHNLPPLEQEPYMPPASQIAKALNYSLISIELPGNITLIATSWATVAKFFKDQLELLSNFVTNSQLKKYTEAAIGSETDPVKKLENIYYYVQTHTQWNGLHTSYPSGNYPAAFKAPSSSASINFLLIQILKQAGFNAFPVLISTRDNGKLYQDFPSVSQFNNLLAGVVIDGKNILMDAATSLTPFGYLPQFDLNGYCLPLLPSTNKLVKLEPLYTGGYAKTIISGIVNEDNTIKGSLVQKYSGYQAIALRNSLIDISDRENFLKPENFEISGFQLSNLEDIKKDLQVKYNFTLNLSSVDSSIFVEPLLGLGIQNPFKTSERKYPIDFVYPASYDYIITLQLPDNYTLKSTPKPAKITLPGNAASYFFYVKQSNNILQIIVKLTFNKTYYPTDEYQTIRNFYTAIDNYQHQIIELVKK